jgi:hypothetical protein
MFDLFALSQIYILGPFLDVVLHLLSHLFFRISFHAFQGSFMYF